MDILSIAYIWCVCVARHRCPWQWVRISIQTFFLLLYILRTHSKNTQVIRLWTKPTTTKSSCCFQKGEEWHSHLSGVFQPRVSACKKTSAKQEKVDSGRLGLTQHWTAKTGGIGCTLSRVHFEVILENPRGRERVNYKG